MRGDLYTGWVNLAGSFPPSLNTSDDITTLKNYESPACYGVDITRDGMLKTGSVPTGTARFATTKRVGKTSKVVYLWHYERLWRSSGADLIWGAKYYDDVYLHEGFGKVKTEQTIVGFQPCLRNQMWIYGANGSQFIPDATGLGRYSGVFDLTHLVQDMVVNTGKGTSTIVIDNIPYCQNTEGIFSYDGNSTKEWTRPIRNSLGTYATEVALTADFEKKFLIGTSAFVVDLTNGKLFDFGTSGFLFTTRTLAGEDGRPFSIGDISFSIQFSTTDTTDGTIAWSTKTEDDDWFEETSINVVAEAGKKTQLIVPTENPTRSAHKFAIKITSLSSNIYIRSIDLTVGGLANHSFAA